MTPFFTPKVPPLGGRSIFAYVTEVGHPTMWPYSPEERRLVARFELHAVRLRSSFERRMGLVPANV